MTDEMTVQGNRPSAMPYAIGGAAIGATAGYFAANKLPFKKPKYSSYDDIIREIADKPDFDKLKEGKSEDVAIALNDVVVQLQKLAQAEQLTYDEVMNAKVDVLDADNAARKEYEAAVKTLKNKTPTDKEIENIAKELNKDAKEITEEMKKSAKEAIEKDKQKYYKKEYEDVKKALDKLIKEAGDEKVLDDAVKVKYDKIAAAASEAGTAFKRLSEICKTGNKKLWALIGGAALAIAGLIVAPKKSKD